jgi:hypothetical protein
MDSEGQVVVDMWSVPTIYTKTVSFCLLVQGLSVPGFNLFSIHQAEEAGKKLANFG